MRTFPLALVFAALAACSVPPVPDVTYFRLPPPTALPHVHAPLSSLPIEVETFRGEGIYAEQALIYATTPQAEALRAYHYQLWSDPPSRALQARLTDMLRRSGIAPLVTDRLPASTPALRVHGRIVRFERVPRDSGFVAIVALEIRVDQDQGEPLIERTYSTQVPAADASIGATVAALAAAIDQDFARFYTDLSALGSGHAD
ncbi:MAG: membrane integrity-associated transporter subunit PqiC [Xanthomonadaceae bacterium]|nr:membrane integrity-associated transporter subunit PqiC [Xanthomonadaceae bacterium]